MNGNNKSTASRLQNCITLIGNILFLSKTDAQSSRSQSSSSEVKIQMGLAEERISKRV